MQQITATWEINNRINLYLLAAIPDQLLPSVASSKGRTVAEHFAHIHNVRLMWLKEALPEVFATQRKLEKENLSGKILSAHLTESANAVSLLFEHAVAEGKLRGFKPHPTAFLGYIIAHESHHRGQIMLCMKQSGHPVDKKVSFGLWEWGVR
jgi:uncharacterized damage-inducible protein DinB